ncbi:hypothetical protein [Trinickia acidisoli]|uniref:hypothetical protein n=1 Tax=Trinickia acidisoli TaxID=2767482 RepID=UPI001A8F1056|nr:hypothetical protein [Trinickia acidisoli]
MNPRSERLVVFLSPTQKRVLAARAARMGISLSELVRRAVLAFDDTGQEVRAAGLVDRLSAAQSEASQNDTLRRLAAGREPVSAPAARHTRPCAGAAGESGHAGAPAHASGARPADQPNSQPVVAAVARALALQAEARPDEQAATDNETLVARVIANETRPPTGEADGPEPFPATGRLD